MENSMSISISFQIRSLSGASPTAARLFAADWMTPNEQNQSQNSEAHGWRKQRKQSSKISTRLIYRLEAGRS